MGEEKPESEWTIEEWKEMRDALVTENEWFKAQLAAIPWDAIAECAVIADDDPDYRRDAKAVQRWIQEAQK